MRFDHDVAEILRDLPGSGPLFPYLRRLRAGDRSMEFHQRCVGLGIKGVSLHSYRYAWAERANKAGYPERFAMENLAQNSKAVHRAYSRKAQVIIPALEDYEKKLAAATAVSGGGSGEEGACAERVLPTTNTGSEPGGDGPKPPGPPHHGGSGGEPPGR